MALLAEGKMPERYQRNFGTVGIAGQIRLLKSKVAVVGAGGLGGTVIELLARLGVGQLRIIDGDTFAVHNLNRQLMSTEHNIGVNKAYAAASRVEVINCDVQAEAIPCMLDEGNAEKLLKGVDVVVDALDNVSTRLLVNRVTKQYGIPLIYAAIAGFTGQVMTIMPGDNGLERIYRQTNAPNQGVETMLGNPAGTPALAASLQVQEVVKVITGIGEPLRNKLLYFDTEMNVFEILTVT
ncbi:MAG: UBA/THIF-type binding protein [Firmicutes bacterium]|nr:UBA/THIF-type binding protein [Bacillota bacterium]